MPENKTEYQIEREFLAGIGNQDISVIELLSKFKQHLIEKEGFMSEADYKRFTETYKGEADVSALCCAVSDVEAELEIIIQSQEKEIESIKKQLEQYQKLIDRFIDSPAKKVITDEEIEYAAKNHFNVIDGLLTIVGKGIMKRKIEDFTDGAKWMQEQLNKKP